MQTLYLTKTLKYVKKCFDLMHGGTSCQFDKNLPSTIYHFTNETLTATNAVNPTTEIPITYIKASESQVPIIFPQAITQCPTKNILIMINSTALPSIANQINTYLSSTLQPNQSLQNITIINYTSDNTQVIYENDAFKKIVNVFSTKNPISTNDKSFLQNIQINKNIQKSVDPAQKSIYQFTQGGAKNITIRFMNTSSKSTKLAAQWWFIWYFNIPPCADVRLSQSSGTCWLNSSINALFLIPSISALIAQRYTSQVPAIPLASFDCPTCSLQTLLSSLVYNLIIQKTKARPSDKNFIAFLASRIKCEYESSSPKSCNNPNYGEGGDSFFGIQTILTHILQKADFLCIDMPQEINKYKNKLIEKYNAEIKKRPPNTLQIQQLLSAIEKPPNDTDPFTDILPPQILIFRTPSIPLKRQIQFNTAQYTICSSIIQLSIPHVICGIICNDKAYVYDSNNILTETDWPNNSFTKYLTDPQTQELYKDKKLSVNEISCAVYIKNQKSSS